MLNENDQQIVKAVLDAGLAVDEDNEPLPTSGLFSVHRIKLWHDDKNLRFPAISIIE